MDAFDLLIVVLAVITTHLFAWTCRAVYKALVHLCSPSKQLLPQPSKQFRSLGTQTNLVYRSTYQRPSSVSQVLAFQDLGEDYFGVFF